jgi:hypothetical protein
MTVETPPAQRLAEIVAHLANEIGPRNIHYYTALRSATDYIEAAFSELGTSQARPGSPASHRENATGGWMDTGRKVAR